MNLGPGQELLHYRIVDKIGEGGMGVVWRATDTTLNRDVALKVLPPHLAADAERLARFEREAQLLAALNHPNIAAVYGLHQVDTQDGSIRFLTMERVEGEDLSQRLARGPMTVERTLDVASQMAAGIEAAHERGVIHRDLKPANVMLTPDGTVKLLDFGLAKAFESDAASSDSSLSPTMTSAGTVAGMILGTAAYMSPEQARGKPVDRRTDLWSFGCVVYECLTAKSLFAGETVSDSLAAILRKDPDFTELPDDTPPMVRLLVRRCLTRNPKQRLRDAGDARLELEQAAIDPSIAALGIGNVAGAGDSGDTAAAAPSKLRWLPWALAALAVFVALFFATRGPSEPAGERHAVRLTIPVDGNVQLGDRAASPPAISPDGRFVIVGTSNKEGETRLAIRAFDSFETRPLDGTEGGNYAFWSPDSRHVGYFLGGTLKRIEVSTGRVQSIGDHGSSFPRGASWGPGGKILFAPNSNSGIWLADIAGGEARQLTEPDPDIPDCSHRWPHFLPDGKHYLFLLWTNAPQELEEHGGVYLASIEGDEPPVRLLPDTSRMEYAATGHILVVQDDNLIAVPFDPGARKITGEPAVVAQNVRWDSNNGYAAFSTSHDDKLVFVRSGARVVPSTLHWYERDGNAAALPMEPAPWFDFIELSPDGRRAAAVLPGVTGDGEVWVVDLERGVRTRLGQAEPWSLSQPLWSPDGERVMFTTPRLGQTDFFTRRADGSGEEQALLVDEVDKTVWDWSKDGRYVLYWRVGSGSGRQNIWIYDIEAEESRSLIEGESSYMDARFSPAGDYMTYSSNDSGRFEVFIQRIADGARWQVSTGGGWIPHWRDDGREIVYMDANRTFHAVDVDMSTRTPALSAPEELFTVRKWIVAFDVAHDHGRFLLATRDESAGEPLQVVLDWPAEL